MLLEVGEIGNAKKNHRRLKLVQVIHPRWDFLGSPVSHQTF